MHIYSPSDILKDFMLEHLFSCVSPGATLKNMDCNWRTDFEQVEEKWFLLGKPLLKSNNSKDI